MSALAWRDDIRILSCPDCFDRPSSLDISYASTEPLAGAAALEPAPYRIELKLTPCGHVFRIQP